MIGTGIRVSMIVAAVAFEAVVRVEKGVAVVVGGGRRHNETFLLALAAFLGGLEVGRPLS